MPLLGESNTRQGFAGAGGGYVVDNSAMFNDGDSEDFSRTFGSGGNLKKWTFSTWFKTTVTGNRQFIFGGGGSHDGYLELTTNYDLGLYNGPNGNLWHWNTKQLFRDPHAWYHVVWVFDSNNATANHRMRFYVNGVETDYSDFTITSNGTQNADGPINEASQVHKIGVHPGPAQDFFDGYLAETVFLDGIVADATSFGEFDSNGVWIPIDVSELNFGTTGFYLDYETSGSDLGDDKSGNGNDFTNNNSVTQSGDTPTENYAVMSSLHSNAGAFAEGGTTAVTDGTDGAQLTGSMAFDSQDSDGYYFIVRPTATSSGGNPFAFGVATVDHANETPVNDAANAASWFFTQNGGIQNTSFIANGSWDAQSNGSGSLNDYYQIAIKAGKMYCGINNTWYDSSDGTFANAGEAFSNLTGMVVPMVQHAHASAGTFQVEFGAFGYTHAKPSGFKDINTTNLKASNVPAIEDGTAHMQTTLYSGTSSTLEVNQSENSTFQPDLLWIKSRDATSNQVWIDAVRGASKQQYSNAAVVDATESDGVTSFDADGFTVGDDSGDYVNRSSENMVAWQWLAGNATSTPSGGSVASTVSVNQTAGFSIVSWTGTGANATIAHGLGAVPKWIIVKNRDSAGNNWAVYHVAQNNTHHSFLDSTNAMTTGDRWQDTTPTSTVFSVDGSTDVNKSTDDMIAWCWAEIPGYSAFGSYEGGANSADGRLVRLDFSPSWLMIKNVDNAGESWYVFDNQRPGYNDENNQLIPNSAAAEGAGNILDLLSNGFKIRANDRAYGGTSNTDTYIYMAFAKNPFAGSAPATAR